MTRMKEGHWPPGPWDDEPDALEWTDAATGLPCRIVRSLMGNLCGYVGVKPSHPAYGVEASKLGLSVHGGLNFAREELGLWWLGFDCAHLNLDIVPSIEWQSQGILSNWPGRPRPQYRTVDYVRHECAVLALQLDIMTKER